MTQQGHPETPDNGAVTPAQQAGELRDLARTDLAAAEARFALLPVTDQRELVLSLPPEERLDLLLLPEDNTALVQALPELDLHRTVQTIGKWEAQEVVAVASEEQINFMLDHDCWRGESLDSRKFLDWIQLFLECDDHQVFRILTGINPDLLALALKKHVRFDHDVMVDDVYFLDPDWIQGSQPVVQLFLERLYALDPNLWVRLLGWVRTHSRGNIEADAIEGRDCRMKGKGFPTHSLAITVYYPVDFDVKALIGTWRAAFALPTAPAAPGVDALVSAGPRREPLFILRLADWLRQHADSPDLECQPARLEGELVEVANKVMVADQVDIGDSRQQRETVDKVRRWISIGLEVAAGGDLAAAAHLLHDRRLEHAFRITAMLFDALGTAVVQVQKREQHTGGRLVSGPHYAAYLALCEPEPLLPLAANGVDTSHPINTLADYRLAWQWIWRLEAELDAP
ncbi:MAG: DUF6178 family protein [Lentisphaeria bacterium]